MQFETFAERDFALDDPAFVEIHPQWHEREPLLLGLVDKFRHLAFVDQQLPFAFGLVIPEGRLRVFGDIATDEPEGRAAHASIGFLELAFAIAEALDLAAAEDDAAFERLEDIVFVPRLAIVVDDFESGRSGIFPRAGFASGGRRFGLGLLRRGLGRLCFLFIQGLFRAIWQ